MADLCKNCKNFEKCVEEGTANDCVDNDYIDYTAKNKTCEGCFYENDLKNDILSPCKKCIRNPIDFREDLFISMATEKEKYNE